MANERSGIVYLVGAGPGDPELITLKGIKALKEADVVLYDHLANPALLDYCRDEAEKIFVGKYKGNHTLPQEKINELLLEHTSNGETVVRLKGGDPSIFGRGGEELMALANLGYEVRVVPGVTSALGVAATTGLPLTHRDYASGVVFLTGHKKKDGDYSAFSRINLKENTLVVYMGLTVFDDIYRELQKAYGFKPSLGALVVENATLPNERRFTTEVSKLGGVLKEEGVSSPALIIVGKIVDFLAHI